MFHNHTSLFSKIPDDSRTNYSFSGKFSIFYMELQPFRLSKFRVLFSASQRLLTFSHFTPKSATCSTKCPAGEVHSPSQHQTTGDRPHNSVEILRKWGCTDDDISKVFHRRPSLRNADLTQLQSKLDLLSGLGVKAADLYKIINCRPNILSSRINHCFNERLEYFMQLFGSKEILCRAIVRNPSLLTYGFHDRIVPIISLYERMGVSRKELITVLISRPTLIPRTSFNDEKMEYIRKTGVKNDSKMFKYIVSLVGVSRIETMQEKVANLEKFGLSENEIWGVFGRSPLLLTLSVDKVQRNMTFIVGTMKLPAKVVLDHPFLLLKNLEGVLKPRVTLGWKIKDMGVSPEMKGVETIMRALRMKEKRFLKVFVKCHPQEVADELMEVYRDAKCVKRLAVDSKKIVRKGFPF